MGNDKLIPLPSYDELFSEKSKQEAFKHVVLGEDDRPSLPQEKITELERRYGVLPPTKDGFFTELGQSAAWSFKQALLDAGVALEHATGYEGLKDYSEDVIRGSQQQRPYEGYKVLSLDPTDLARTIGMGVGSSAGGLAAGGAGLALSGGNPYVGMGAMATVTFAQIYGNEYLQFAKEYPDASEQELKALAFASAIPQTLIEVGTGPEALMFKKMLTKVGKKGFERAIRRGALRAMGRQIYKKGGRAAIEATKSGFEEGMEEVTQNLWHQIAEAYQSGDPERIKEAFDPEQVAQNFVGGFVGGVGMGAPMVATQGVYGKITGGGNRQKNALKDILDQEGTVYKETTDRGASVLVPETPERKAKTAKLDAALEAQQKGQQQQESEKTATPQTENVTEPKIEFSEKHFTASTKKDDNLHTWLKSQYLDDNTNYKILEPKTKKEKGKGESLTVLQSFVKRLTDSDAVFFADDKSNDPNTPMVANGFYDKENKKMYINVGNGVEVNPLSIAGHEFAHQLKQTSPEEYKLLTDKIEKAIPDDYKQFIEAQQEKITSAGNNTNVKEEFYNNVIGDHFAKPEFWEKVFEGENESTVKRIGRAVVRILKNIKNRLDGSRYADAKVIKNFDEIQKTLIDVVKKRLPFSKKTSSQPNVQPDNIDLSNAETKIRPIENSATTVYTPKKSEPFKLKQTGFMEMSDIINSFNEGYDQKLQPRNREGVASKEQIQEIFDKFNPQRLFDNTVTSDGRPIILPNHMVISGNGRIEVLRKVFQDEEKRQQYIDAVHEYAQKHNVDISGMKQPVYVGVLDPKEMPRIDDFLEDSNDDSVLKRSEAEQALRGSKVLVANNMALMDKFKQSDDGTVNTSANREFLNQFVNETSSQDLITSSGAFSDKIEDRVNNAMIIALSQLADKFPKETAINLIEEKNALGLNYPVRGILANIKDLFNLEKVDGYKIINHVGNALATLVKFKQAVRSGEMKFTQGGLDAFLAQGDMFGGEIDLSPQAEIILRAFIKENSYSGINKYLSDIIKEINYNASGDNLFEKQKTLDEILGVKKEAQEVKEQTNRGNSNETQTQEETPSPPKRNEAETQTNKNETNSGEPAPTNTKGQSESNTIKQINANDELVKKQSDLVHNFLIALRANQPITRNSLKKTADAADMHVKDVEEAMERAVVERAGELNSFDEIMKLYDAQPSLITISAESKEKQAFSTPIPIAYTMQDVLGVIGNKDLMVYDPTGGLGMLESNVPASQANINELWEPRYDLLKERGNYASLTNNDALTYQPNARPNVLVMNPPFGAGAKKTINGYKLSGIDHVIAAKALEHRMDDGTTALIVGAGLDTNKEFSDRDITFSEYLYHNFNIHGDMIIGNNLYRKQGTTYPVRLLFIGHKKVDSNPNEYLSPKKADIQRINSFEELKQETDKIKANMPKAGEMSTATEEGANETQTSNNTNQTPIQNTSNTSNTNAGTNNNNSEEGVISTDDPIITPEIVDEVKSPEHQKADNVSQNTEAPESMPEPYDHSLDTDPNAAFAKTDSTPVNGLQNVTRLVSHGKSLTTVTPKELDAPMLAGSLQIQSKVGKSLDDYLVEMLQYESKEKMWKGLAAEQVEGIAKALYKITREGKAIIIADETGVGKGRQAAGVMRWALLNNKVPVFFTKMPKLFSDMYFDGKAIGTDFQPLIIGNRKESTVVDGDGNTHVKPLSEKKQKAELHKVSRDSQAWEDSQYNTVFITYSQIQKSGNSQQEYLRSLVTNNDVVLVLDESHTAAGEESNTSDYIKRLLDISSGAVYLSATYAKRVSNFGVYNKTSLGQFEDMGIDLDKVFSIGGAPLQQLIAQGLAEDNEMIRREKDFSMVEFNSKVVKDPSGNTVKTYDKIANILGDIVDFSARLSSQTSETNRRNRSRDGANSLRVGRFAAVLHNFISQLSLGLKVDAVVQEAVDATNRGQKPFIAVRNTLQAVLDNIPSDAKSLNYLSYLQNIVDRFATITITTPQGEEVQQIISGDNPLYQNYLNIKNKIDELGSIDMPISPIDYIVGKLNAMNIPTGEITGRTLGYKYEFDANGNVVRDSQGNMVGELYNRKAETKNTITNQFNDGTYTALLINSSGSTGLSAHASIEYDDKKQRYFILAQPDRDINTVKQAFGRVHRTGQVVDPEYMILSSELTVEKKELGVLMKKLNSLTANTTGEQKSGINLGNADMFNVYGDMAARTFLAENPIIAAETRLDSGDDSVTHEGKLLGQLMGRIAILPNAQQQEIMDDVEQLYNDIVNEAKASGTYSLNIAEFPEWNAETVSEKELVKSKGDSYFSRGVVNKKIRYKKKIQTLSVEDVEKEFSNNAGAVALSQNTMNEFIKGKQTIIKESFQKQIDDIRNSDREAELKQSMIVSLENKRREIIDLLNRMMFSNTLVQKIEGSGEVYAGTLVDIKLPKAGNMAASKIKLRFATDTSPSHVTIPVSKTFRTTNKGGVIISRMPATPQQIFLGGSHAIVQERYVLEGNHILAIDMAGEGGRIIKYSNSEGNMITAYAPPQSWTPQRMAFDPTSVVSEESNSVITEAIKKHRGILKIRNNPNILLGFNGRKGIVEFAVLTANRARAGREELRSIHEAFPSAHFYKRGSSGFFAELNYDEQISDAIDIMKSRGVTFIAGEEAAEFLNSNRSPEASVTFKQSYKQVNPVVDNPEYWAVYDAALDEYAPERVSFKTLNQEASQYIKEHGAKEIIYKMANGQYNDESTFDLALMKYAVASDENYNLIKQGDTKAYQAVEEYFKIGTKYSHGLGIRRLMKRAVIDKDGNVTLEYDYINALKLLLALPTKKLRNAKTEVARKHIIETYEKKRIKQAIDDLLKEGIDIETLTNEDLIKDPALYQKAVNIISAAKAGWDDKFYEFWVNGLLSLPKTHVANVIGNSAMTFTELFPQRFVEASLASFYPNSKGTNRATFGEIKYMLRAIQGNFKQSWMNAYDAWHNELPNDGSKIDTNSRIAIRGKWGKFVRTPGRSLNAADIIFKGVVAPTEATAMAYRIATRLKGLTDKAEIEAFIKEELSNPNSESVQYGFNRAKELAFQDPGKFSSWINRGKEMGGISGNILRYIFPFSTTSISLAVKGIRKSPLGLLAIFPTLASKNVDPNVKLQRVAEQIVAWTTMGLILGLAKALGGDDDDEDPLPRITGTQELAWYKSGGKWLSMKVPPLSIRIGDKWYSFARVEPFATTLGFYLDLASEFKMVKRDEDGIKILGKMFNSMQENITNKTFTKNLHDMISAAESPNAASKIFSNFISSWVPNIIRGTASAFSDEVKYGGTHQRGMDAMKYMLVDRTIHRAGGNVTIKVPYRDFWGDAIKKDSFNDWGGTLWRWAVPISIQDNKMAERDKLLWNYNQSHPDTPYFPSLPRPYYTYKGERHYIEDPQIYDKYAVRAGNIAKQAIDNAIQRGILDVEHPGEKERKFYDREFKKARKQVLKEVIRYGQL